MADSRQQVTGEGRRCHAWRRLLLLGLLAACAPAVEYTLLSLDAGVANGSSQDSGGSYTSHSLAGGITSIEGSSGSYTWASGYIATTRLKAYVNAQPTLDAIADQTVLEDSDITALTLTGISDGSVDETQALTVTASSSDPSIVLDPTITYLSPGATATLSFAPVPNRSGTVTITVTVRDAGGTLNGATDTISRSFAVTVSPVNDSPTLAQPADLIINEDAGLQTVALTGIGPGTGESQVLTVTAFSSDLAKIPDPTVSYSSPNSTGSLSFTPVADAFGLVNIVVMVRDSGGTANGGVDSFTRIFSVDIQATNDPPALVTNLGLTLEATKSGIVSFDLLRVIDDDPPQQLVYTLTAIPSDGELRRNGVALTTNGTLTQADINAGIITYKHTGSTAGSDGFTFFVADPGGLTTLGATFPITITASGGGSNDAPVVTLPSGTQTWIEGDSPLLIDSAATATDADGTLAGGVLTVSIIAGADSSDRTAIRNVGTGPTQIGVSGSIVTWEGNTLGSFSGGSGSTPLAITLGGGATPTMVTGLLRAITYRSVSGAPPETDRDIQVVLDDGAGGISAPVLTRIQVQGVNSAPTIAFAQTTLAYLENDGAVLIDAAATVSDGDSSDFAGGDLVLAISSGASAQDVLGIRHQGGGSGQVSLVGSSVGYEGTVIGSVTGGSSGTPLTVAFNAAATPEAVQALARVLTFANAADNPNTTTRTLTWTVSDGDGGTSGGAELPVVMTAVNDPPVLTTPTSAIGYTEGDGAVAVAGDGTVSDVDSADFDTGLLRLAIVSGATADDGLQIANLGNGSGQIGVSGGSISYGGVVIASYGGAVSGSTEMLIALDADATATAVQALVRALRYSNVSPAPTTGTRQVDIRLTDGDGGSSPVRSIDINVTDLNSAPQLLLSGATPTYIENAAPTIVDGAISVSDADSANFDGGALIVTIAAAAEAGDQLGLQHGGFGAGEVGVVGSQVYYSGALIGDLDTSLANSLIVSFNFASTATGVAAVASAVTFSTPGEDPGTAPRTIAFAVTDGDGDASTTQTATMAVQTINDAPGAAASNLATVAGIPLGFFLPGSDPEGDALSFSLLSQPGNGTVTLDDATTGAITFAPSGSGGGSFTYQISDGSDSSTPITVTTYITALDDPRPHPISAPPLAAVIGDGFSYQIQVDTRQLAGEPDLTFVLTGDVPVGMSLTETGDTTATISWTADGTPGEHLEFGILFMDPAANRAGYQAVLFLVQSTAAPLGDG